MIAGSTLKEKGVDKHRGAGHHSEDLKAGQGKDLVTVKSECLPGRSSPIFFEREKSGPLLVFELTIFNGPAKKTERDCKAQDHVCDEENVVHFFKSHITTRGGGFNQMNKPDQGSLDASIPRGSVLASLWPIK